SLHTLGAVAIAFIDHKDVSDLHDPSFNGLHIVAHAGHQDHHRDVSQPHDVDFILPDAYRFDHYQVASGGVEDGRHIGGGPGEAAQRSAGSHAADVNSRIGEVILHADAVAENRSAGVGAGGVDGDDPHAAVFLAIVFGQLIDERALARTGSS